MQVDKLPKTTRLGRSRARFEPPPQTFCCVLSTSVRHCGAHLVPNSNLSITRPCQRAFPWRCNWLGLSPSTARAAGLISGPGTKVLLAAQMTKIKTETKKTIRRPPCLWLSPSWVPQAGKCLPPRQEVPVWSGLRALAHGESAGSRPGRGRRSDGLQRSQGPIHCGRWFGVFLGFVQHPNGTLHPVSGV